MIGDVQNLKMFQSLNLSLKYLTREVRERGIFANKKIVVSLIGNPSLRRPQSFHLLACKTLKGYSALVKIILLPVSGAIAFMLCCLVLRFLRKGNVSMQKFYSSNCILQKI